MSSEATLLPADTLIVDDVGRLRDLVAEALSKTGRFRVVGQAADGEEAIQKARELEPDLVVLDLSMPRMDGLEALTAIRRTVPGVDIVVHSGFDSERLEALVKDHGAVGYIEKGIGGDELVERLSQLRRNGTPSPTEDASASAPGRDSQEPGAQVHVVDLDGSLAKRVEVSLRSTQPSWELSFAQGRGLDEDVPASADAILVLVGSCGQRWIPTVRALSSRNPEKPVIVAVPGAAEGCLEAALEAGATEVIDLDLVDDDLVASQIRWAMLVEERHSTRTRRLELLAGTMAHDLRQPLRALDRYADWVKEGLENGDEERVETALNGLQRGVSRARRLIDSQLAYAQLQTKPPTATEADPSEALHEALENLEDRVERSGATVTVSELPSVLAPPEHLVVLFRNLLSNAIKYREDGQAPRLEVDGEVERGTAVIRVSDDGIGIAPEHQDEIFDPFTRLHAEQDYPGTGLGLAICKELVEQAGGRIEVDSALGKGTTMVVRLPRPRLG